MVDSWHLRCILITSNEILVNSLIGDKIVETTWNVKTNHAKWKVITQEVTVQWHPMKVVGAPQFLLMTNVDVAVDTIHHTCQKCTNMHSLRPCIKLR
jgi:hypothetical protein